MNRGFLDIPHEPEYECGAYARSTGKPCKQYAMANGRCYLHGGKTPIKHGRRTKRAIAERKLVSQLIRDSKSLIEEITE